jgi:hypothetical protein
MNDTAIKNYAIWARRQLVEEVAKKCSYWGIYEKDSLPASTDVIDGRIVSSAEKSQREKLLSMLAADGYEQLVEKAAYTWFNRLLAIRFMEVNDRLPSHIRLLSSPDGSFAPQAIKEALYLPLDALDQAKVQTLIQAGNDEDLFREIFLAQCDELAQCMPAVFEPVGSAMELLLPDGLLRQDGIVEQLVNSIPEDDWLEGVEIVGWMYQYYVSERKDAVFASFKKGKKAERDAIAPATQLFTPNWIVRYLTENSLGRLWVLNHPESDLPDSMPYFVKPDEDAESDFEHISSPEDISVVDPACGSGHILVYAFELLSKIYAEAGYSNRDAARLIVEKNLHGFEIDPRAAAMASFAVTMKACELDSRFLRRGVMPQITTLNRIEFTSEEAALIPTLHSDSKLRDALAHLDECGSLLAPTQEQIDSLARDLATLAGNDTMFAVNAKDKLEQAVSKLTPLSKRYSVVAANPPYMGSGNMDKWLGAWVKNNYKDAYRDLCTSFIDRGFTLSCNHGFSAMVTMQSWMFLGSYEKLRKKILKHYSISSMAHLGTRAFGAIGGEVVSTTATIFNNGKEAVEGTYFRLVDMGSEAEKQAGNLEALANPNCGWLYRRNAEAFEVIPGSPIAYWASSNLLKSFRVGTELATLASPKVGLQTGENERFVRLWWEPSRNNEYFTCSNTEEAARSNITWFPYNKGGDYRKWYGNNDFVINWERNGEMVREFSGSVIRNYDYYFQPSITWSKISSGKIAFRYKPAGHVFDVAGTSIFGTEEDLKYLQAACNSSVIMKIAGLLSPTLNFEVGQIAAYPIIDSEQYRSAVADQVDKLRTFSRNDYDAFETSWDFKKHPLL